jgi:hypothetical protein
MRPTKLILFGILREDTSNSPGGPFAGCCGPLEVDGNGHWEDLFKRRASLAHDSVLAALTAGKNNSTA